MQRSRNMVHSHFTLSLRARDYVNRLSESRVLTITRSRLLAHLMCEVAVRYVTSDHIVLVIWLAVPKYEAFPYTTQI